MTNAEIVILVFTGLFLITVVGCIIFALFYNREDNGVECNDCGVYVSKYKAQKILFMVDGIMNTYYCNGCKKNYDSIGSDGFKTIYYKTERFEVDNNGKRIEIKK